MLDLSITYDREEFYRALSEVQGYLAELRSIDTALAYLEKEKASWWHGTPVGPRTHHIEVKLGTTFPVTKVYEVPEDFFRLFWQESRKTEVERHLQVLAKEAGTWAATEIETIADLVRPFTWPISSAYQKDCVDPVVAAKNLLEDEVSVDFGKLRHSLGNWEGPAAESFASNFYHPFEHTLRSQKVLLNALATGIAAAKVIAESTQHSLMSVVHHMREALREQLQLCQAKAELARQESIRNVFVIAGGAITVFGGFLSGGGLWTTRMAMAAGGTSIASTAMPDGAWTALNLRGATAEDLLNSFWAAIRQTSANDGEQHKRLSAEIKIALDRVKMLRASPDGEDGRLIPPQPEIASGVNGSDFYLP